MILPKDQEEIKGYVGCALDVFSKLNEEISEEYPAVNSIGYNDHSGIWEIRYVNKDFEIDEFESFSDLMQFLIDDSSED